MQWVARPYGVLPYCWSHWMEFFPQMQRLERRTRARRRAWQMRYGITTHDMDYERARVAELEELARLDGA